MMLNDPMLWRIVWKEYRAQRGFALAVAGVGIVFMLLLAVTIDRPQDRLVPIWGVAGFLPAFYALGCAATLFASEREEQTVDLLRIFAARTGRFFWGKVGFSLVSAVIVYGLLLALAMILTASSPRAITNPERMLPQAAWLGVQFLCWGFLFSALCRKVLVAVPLAGFTPFLVKLAWQSTGRAAPSEDWWYNDLALPLPLLLFSYIATRQMLRDRSVEWSWARLLRLPHRTSPGLKWLAADEEVAPLWQRTWSRLIWLEAMQVLTLGHFLWIAGLLAFAFVPLYHLGDFAPLYQFGDQRAVFTAVALPFLMGLWSLHSEAGRRTRFLAETGLPPAVVWLTRHVVWMFAAAALTSPLVQAIHNFERVFRIGSSTCPHWSDVLIMSCLCYCAGQFASMLIPRTVTAGFVGVVLSALLCGWLMLMTGLKVPLALAVAPLAAVLLAATLGWSRNWLLERATGRSYLKLGAFVAGSFAVVWGGVGAYRVAEIPRPDELWSAGLILDANRLSGAGDGPVHAEETETARMYLQACQGMPTGSPEWELDSRVDEPPKTVLDGWEFATEHDRTFLANHQQDLAILLAASQRETCIFAGLARHDFPGREWWQKVQQLSNGASLALLSARELEAEGRLDEALERYLAVLRMSRHLALRGTTDQWAAGNQIAALVEKWMPRWAAHPEQTAERIHGAVARVQAEFARFPPLRDALAADHADVREKLLGNWDELAPSGPDAPIWERVVFNLMEHGIPWEKSRALHVAELSYIARLQCADVLEQALDVPGRDPIQWSELAGGSSWCSMPDMTFANQLLGDRGWKSGGRFAPQTSDRSVWPDQPPWQWVQTTPSLQVLAAQSPPGILLHTRLSDAVSRRALLLQLELLAWKHAHGSYPQRLDDLPDVAVTGIIDPWTGREFGYRGNGFPRPVLFQNGKVEAGQPLFWSAGERDARVVATTSGEYRAVDWIGPIGPPPKTPSGTTPPIRAFRLP